MNSVGTASNAGSCLGDCTTNVFSLASTKGLKWKKYCSVTPSSKTVSEDPVLSSYSNALACGTLAVWRCTGGSPTALAADEHCNLTLSPKEIIFFWYGSQPHWSSLVSPLLQEVEKGSTEYGWSVDCQQLFYQALQNLLERNLAKSGVRRVGDRFVEIPDDLSDTSDLLAFGFHFFTHGEGTVVVAINCHPHVPIRKLKNDDIVTACSNGGNLPVVLSPYGINGVLTGNTLSRKDSSCIGLLEDWEKFFPSDQLSDANLLDVVPHDQPCLAEVAVGERLLMYPLRLIFVPQPPDAVSKPAEHVISSSKDKENLFQLSKAYQKVNRKERSSRAMLRQILRRLGNSSDKPRVPPSGLKTEGVTTGTDSSAKPLWDFKENNRHPACICLSSAASALRVKTTSRFTSLSHQKQSGSSLATAAGSSQAAGKRDQRKPAFPFHQRSLHQARSMLSLPSIVASRRISSTTATPQLQEVMDKNESQAASIPSCEPGGLAKSITEEATHRQTTAEHTKKISDAVIGDENGNELDLSKYCQPNRGVTDSLYLLPPSLVPHRPSLKSSGTEDNQWDAHLKDLFSAIGSEEKPTSCIDLTAGSPKDHVTQGKQATTTNDITEQTNIDTKSTVFSKHVPNSNSKKRRGGRALSRQSSTQSPKPGNASPQIDPFAAVFDDDKNVLNGQEGSSQPKRARTVANDHLASMTSPPPSSRPHAVKSRRSSAAKTAKNESKNGGRQRKSAAADVSQTTATNLAGLSALPSPPTPQFSSPTPRHPSQSLMSTKDLTVRLDDLDRLFDDSDEERQSDLQFGRVEDGDIGNSIKQEASVLPSHCIDGSPGLTSLDDVSSLNNQQKGSMANQTAPFSQHDLAQMFPTPPSQEASNLATSPAMVVCGDHPMQLSTAHPGTLLSPDRVSSSFMVHQQILVSNVVKEDTSSVSNGKRGSSFHTSGLDGYQSHMVCDLFAPLAELPSSKMPVRQGLSQLPKYEPSWNGSNRQVNNSDPIEPLSNITLNSKQDSATSATAAKIEVPFVELEKGTASQPSESVSSVTPDSESALSKKQSICSQTLEIMLALSSLGAPHLKGFDPTNQTRFILPASFRSFLGSIQSQATRGSDSQQLDPSLSESNVIAGDEKCTDFSMSFQCCSPLPSIAQRKDALALPLTQEKDTSLNLLQFSPAFELYLDQYSTPLTSMFMAELIDHHYAKSDASCGSCKRNTMNGMGVLPEVSKAYVKGMLPKLQSALSTQLHSGFGHVKVEGPLSFQSLHKQTGKVGLQNKVNVHPLLVGHDGDWMSLSPIALRFWDKLMLEPYAGARDVAYVVVAPDNEILLNSSKLFFKEHSAVYESLNLGRHVPINKTLRDGILRVGAKAMQKLANEKVADYFGDDESAEGKRMKLIAQVCKYHLGPYLSTLILDDSLLKSTEDKAAEAKSKRHPANIGVPSHCATSVPDDGSLDENKQSVPAIVIYMIDPFPGMDLETNKSDMWSYVSLLKCYTDMAMAFSEKLKQNVFVQILPVGYLMKADNNCSCELSPSKHTRCHYKQLAMALYSRCRIATNVKSTSKALTGFGIAGSRDWLIRKRKSDNQLPSRLYLPPCILASAPALLREDLPSLDGLATSIDSVRCNILMCAYTVSHDQQWLIVSVTDRRGELSDTCAIRLEPGRRSKRRAATARASALRKLVEYCQGFMSFSSLSWRLVLTRLGRPGLGEWEDLKSGVARLLEPRSRTISPRGTPSPTCDACTGAGRMSQQQSGRPSSSPRAFGLGLRSVSFVSVERELNITVFPNETEDPGLWPSARVFITSPSVLSLSVSRDSPRPSTTLANPRPLHPSMQCGFPSDPSDANMANVDDDGYSNSLRNLIPLLSSPEEPTASPMQPPVRQGRGGNSPLLANSFRPVQPSPIMQRNSRSSPSGNARSSPRDHVSQPLAIGHLVSQQNVVEALPGHGLKNRLCLLPDVVKYHLLFHVTSNDAFAYGTLDTQSHLEVLRFIIEQHDALSWLTVTPETGERRSCFASHVFALMRTYNAIKLLASS